jgi:feruloyl esterase
MAYAVEMYKYAVLRDPAWDYLTFDVDKDVALADKVAAGMMNSIDPNLRPFFAHGGKLLQYHGWSDPGIPPRSSVNYYKSVLDTLDGALGGQVKSGQ